MKTRTIELVFLIDCTLSMKPYFLEVKNNIHTLVAEIAQTNCQMKVAFVGYTDHKKLSEYHFLDFTRDVDAFKKFVENIQEQNGVDFVEDVRGGVELVDKLSFGDGLKLVIHIGDAPTHGRR